MTKAWACIDHPEHGLFRQASIERLQATDQRFRRGPGPLTAEGYRGNRIERFACPICARAGESAFVRPATEEETRGLAA